MVEYIIKDLYKAIQSEVIFINRLGNKLSDRNNMLDHRQDALVMIKDFDHKYGLSKCMKKFLVHMVYQAAMLTNNM